MSKKRRSSTFSHAASTPAPRGSSGHDDTAESVAAETPVAILERAQEDAERRGRVRIQKRQSLGHAMAHAAVAAATGQQTPVQADGTPIQPGSAVRGFSQAQLSEHYANCMKLSAENKINVKNAFHLQLIDYMTEMMRKKASDLDNFQAASCALDASAKIYAYRVDSVHSDTLKLAGGVGKSTGNEEAGVGGGDMPIEGEELTQGSQNPEKAKRKKKATATVEKNINNINCSKFDLEFDVDPLFKKTSAQFDSGGGSGGQFLYNLFLKDSSRAELLLDSNAILSLGGEIPLPSDADEDEGLEGDSPEGVDDDRLAAPGLVIAPTFSNFTFRGWSVDEDEASTDEKKGEEEKKNDEHAFDADAAPILDDDGMDFDGGPDNFAGGDSFLGDDNVGYDDGEVRVGNVAAGQGRDNVVARERGVSLALIDNLREHLLSAPSEYSYFDQGRLGAWAGPKHWKFKPMRHKNLPPGSSDPGQPGPKGKTKGKKVEKEEYEFDELFAECEMAVLLESVEKTMKIPKKSVGLQGKTMERWSDDKLLLPRDLDYKGKDFSRSFVTDFHITGVKEKHKSSQNLDDTVGDYDFDNPNDTAEFCPNVGEDGDMDDMGGMDDDNVGFDDATVFPTQTQNCLNGEDGNGLTMVQAPNRVEKVQIGYAKQAKKMDMRKLKTIEWKILQCAAASLNKENEDANAGSIEAAVADRMTSPINFKDMYHSLHEPNRMPPKMVENLSVPLAFVALLHLCNEKSLALECVEDFSDFVIQQG